MPQSDLEHQVFPVPDEAPVQHWLIVQLLLRWQFVTLLPAAAALIAGVLLLVRPRQFTTRAAVVPVSNNSTGLPGGLAAGFGLGAIGLDPFGPEYYAVLFKSDEVLKAAAVPHLPIVLRTGDTIGGLEEWFGVEGDSGRRIELIVRKLRGLVRTDIDAQSGILSVSVKSKDPIVSAYIVDQLLGHVQDLDGARLSAQARAEGTYLVGRLRVVDSEYQAAVASLRRFLEQNRDIRSSPALQFQQDELTREANLRAAIRTDLEQRLEQARANEARDTPVLAVLQAPVPSTLPDSRGIVLRVSLAFVVGGMVGLLWLLLAVVFEAEARRFPDWHKRVSDLLRSRSPVTVADATRRWFSRR